MVNMVGLLMKKRRDRVSVTGEESSRFWIFVGRDLLGILLRLDVGR